MIFPSASFCAVGFVTSSNRCAKRLRPDTSRAWTISGSEYSEPEIVHALEVSGLSRLAQRFDDVTKPTAQKLAEGKIIAWFQGRMEVGARALGNRSILASPLFVDTRDRLNNKVKHREAWRPFCPSILKERASDWIQLPDAKDSAPFMIVAYPVKPGKAER